MNKLTDRTAGYIGINRIPSNFSASGIWSLNSINNFINYGNWPESVITNGVVLYLDAGNKNSYPGTGNLWSGLKDNINANLFNNVGYNSNNFGYLTFNGLTNIQYGRIPSILGVTNFTQNNNYTISFWVYLNQIQTDTRNPDVNIIEKWYDNTTFPGYPYVIRYIHGTQQITANVWNGSSSITTSIQVSHSNWWYINAVYNWSSNILRLYGNGTSIFNSTTLNLGGTISNNSNLYLMARGDPVGNPYNLVSGRLSMLKIYNRALSEEEIIKNFNALRKRYDI